MSDRVERPPIEAIIARLERYEAGVAAGRLDIADCIGSTEEELTTCRYALHLEARLAAPLPEETAKLVEEARRELLAARMVIEGFEHQVKYLQSQKAALGKGE